MQTVDEVDELLAQFLEEGTSIRTERLFTSLEDAYDAVEDNGYIFLIRGSYTVHLEITKPVHIVGHMTVGAMNNTLNSSIMGEISYRCPERSSFNHLTLQGEDGTLLIEGDSNLAFKRVIVYNGFDVHLCPESKLEIFRCNMMSGGKVSFKESFGRLMCLSSTLDTFDVELYKYIIVQTRLFLATGDVDNAVACDTLVAFIISIGMKRKLINE